MHHDDVVAFKEEGLDAVGQLQVRGIAVPSQTVLGGRFAIRVCITNHRTDESDLDLLVRETVRIGEELVAAGTA